MRTAKLWKPAALAAAVVSAIGLTAIPATASGAGRHAPPSAARPAAARLAAARPRPLSGALARLERRRLQAARLAGGIAGGGIAGGGIAGASGTASGSGPAGASGTVTGRVLGVHAAALPGACVTAIGTSGSFMGMAKTDGRFVISGLPAGRYALEYRDCAAPSRYFAQRSGDASLPGSARQIEVTAGRVLTLQPVTLRPTSPAALLPVRRPLLRYPAGQRGLTASTSGHISGVVTDTASHPVKGICVIAFPIDGGSAFAVGTDKTGAYTTGPLAPGSYEVDFSAGCNNRGNWLPQTYKDETAEFPSQPPTPVTVTAGQTTTGIDAAMLLGGAITGTVTNRTGRGLPGICVLAFKQTKHTFSEIEAPTGRHGRYDLGSLFPGQYRVQFSTGCGNNGNYAPLWWPRAATLSRAHFVRVALGKVHSGINAALRPGAEISGTVRFARRGGKPGRPLRGICVVAGGRGAAADVEVQAATGRGGKYLVKGLKTGRYRVSFSAGCGNNGNFVASAHRTAVRARAGHVTKGINGVLHRGGTISGVVRNAHGKPLSGICLQLEPFVGAGELPQTGAHGRFAITQLPAGTFTLEFSGGCDNPGNFVPQWYRGETDGFAADPIKVRAGQARFGINAVMRPAGTVSGHVTDRSGQGLAGVCVIATTPTVGQFGADEFLGLGVTGKKGNYQITSLTPGQYEVGFLGGCGSAELAEQWYRSRPDFRSAALISVRPGIPATGIDAVMQPGGGISGVVTSPAGHRLSTVCALATSLQTGAPTAQGEVFIDHGTYRLTDLTPGTYSVEFFGCVLGKNWATQWYKGQDNQASATPVTVTGGHRTTGIGAIMTRGATISGHVLTRAGQPIRHACVDAFDPATGAFGFAETGRHGQYTVTSLNTGSYRLAFSLCDQGKSSLAGIIRPRPVRVTAPDAVTGIDVTLRPGGSISGVVLGRKPRARPQGGVCVEAVPTARNGFGGFAFTSPSGRYIARGLTPGVYQVFFDPNCAASVSTQVGQWYKNKSAQRRATPVRVRVGTTRTGIDARLASDGSISGRVTGPSGTALTGACVTAVPLAGPRAVIGVTEKGGYALVDMPPGRYRVKFGSGCGITGLATQWWRDAPTKAKATIITVRASQDTGGISAALRP